MEEPDVYTTKALADLADISPRTLRYYDSIGLLVPGRLENGYRVYGSAEVHRLQYILFLRSCGIPLSDIAFVLDDPDSDLTALLRDHLARLCRQREYLDKTIAAVQGAIAREKEFNAMDDGQRFEALKRESIERFEATFGPEARQQYGNEVIDAANERMLTMSEEAWESKEELEKRIKERLTEAFERGEVDSPLARMVAEMHAQWIKVHWGEGYSPASHRALAEGYVGDPRFVEYYDSACGQGATAFLRDIILANIREKG